MEKDIIKQFRLGVFLIVGTLLLLMAMYFIGRNQNLFGPTIRLVAVFHNVNGLQPGNIVRFSGTDAGTVEAVEVINDTAVEVTIVLQEKYSRFIRQNAVASIGTDGLMGNKLVNIINSSSSEAPVVSDGSRILTIKPVETDEMLRTLNQTNEYVSAIALNLKNITDKISNSKGTVWKLLSDTMLSGKVDTTFANFLKASANVSSLSKNLQHFGAELNKGKGLAGTLTRDSLIGLKLHDALSALQKASEQTRAVTDQLLGLSTEVGAGKGNLGFMLKDSSLSIEVKQAVLNFRESSESLIQVLEALKKSPLLKRYIDEEKSEKKKK